MHDRHNVAEHFGNMWLEYSKKKKKDRRGEGKIQQIRDICNR